MKKVEDYLQHAAECREMARKASAAHREQLEQMAETWEQLAQVRRQQLAKRRFPGHQQSGSSLSRR